MPSGVIAVVIQCFMLYTYMVFSSNHRAETTEGNRGVEEFDKVDNIYRPIYRNLISLL
jgi:hypothetical protein